MKLCFSSLGSPQLTITQLIETAKKCQYDGIEIRAVQNTTDIWQLKDFQTENLDKTAEKFRKNTIEVVCIGSSIRFNQCSDQWEKTQLETAATVMNIAEKLGSKYIRVFAGPLLSDKTYGESLRCIIRGFNKLSQLGEKYHVMPLLETHDDFSTAVRCMELLEGVKSTNFGIIWDILHPFRFGEKVQDTYKILKPYIRHVHIKDSSAFSAKEFNIELLGKGTVPIQEAINCLKNGGYDSYLCFEWEKFWHPEISEYTVAFPHYKTEITRYL